MKRINSNIITKTIINLCVEANLNLRRDVLSALKSACRKENNSRAKNILGDIIQNAAIARKERLAICQDTGMPLVFAEIGQDVKIIGDLKKAINKGIDKGYKKASLRNSIVGDPLLRGNSKYSPAVIHIDLVKGNKLKLTVLPKGFGCENKSALKMFNPTVSIDEVGKFIINTVKAAGPNACPPYVVGVGIGGTADYACLLAKKALLRKIRNPKSKLEKDLLASINKLNIGPMGLGGDTTALAVNIETYPTHIAGLPVAVNISCHALRSATEVL
ncbi:MAG: fumarate hydratase [Candidatus Omnitrophica bacterium]|nr:fumarate hydratase [Candidatus Omnitrophota bacterium]MDD5352015.1 fumarate hydratase [Candidatus Omnitrophota bacterium]MDD5551069.1 fumarate hydratase [Candidatus Omnitrophota bacterium]